MHQFTAGIVQRDNDIIIFLSWNLFTHNHNFWNEI